jgi:hypothetical protein
MAYALLAVFVLAWAVGIFAWVGALWNLLRIPFHLKPGVALWATGNPLNHLLNSESLTATGLAARKRLGQFLALFVCAVGVGGAAGLLVKWAA